MSKAPYQIKRYATPMRTADTNKPVYEFTLYRVNGGTLPPVQIASAQGTSIIAPAWLRHRQAVLNTKAVLG